MIICSANALAFQRGGEPLLSGLSFDIPQDSLTFILGANGSGKTLLLRLLQGLAHPGSGTLRWRGSRPLDRRVILQKPVFLERSVLHNMLFVTRALGLDRAAARTALEHAGLADKAGQQAHSLSGGEQQRLAFARETLGRPKVLLLDEPTANLDRKATADLEGRMTAVRATGAKIILVTHNRDQVARLAKRHASDVLFLHQGRLRFSGRFRDFESATDPHILRYKDQTTP